MIKEGGIIAATVGSRAHKASTHGQARAPGVTGPAGCRYPRCEPGGTVEGRLFSGITVVVMPVPSGAPRAHRRITDKSNEIEPQKEALQ